MESKHKAGHLGEAHEPAEHDMRRQPRIDLSKRLKDRIYVREVVPAVSWIVGIVGAVYGALKLGGIW